MTWVALTSDAGYLEVAHRGLPLGLGGSRTDWQVAFAIARPAPLPLQLQRSPGVGDLYGCVKMLVTEYFQTLFHAEGAFNCLLSSYRHPRDNWPSPYCPSHV